MNERNRHNEKGQSLVILTISLVAFLAFVALALDGGNTYVHRRQAQTASDAGALAGARTYCETESTDAAIDKAEEYAITRNGADSAGVYIDTEAATVQVNTAITFDTFLAHLIGRDNIQVTATATAGCSAAGSGIAVLPLAWACRPPVAASTSEECNQLAITEETLDQYLTNPPASCDPICPELYVIMSSNTTEEEYCMPTGPVDCDFNDDGIPDILPSSDRSWLNLDGGPNSSDELVGWIRDGFDGELGVHWWIPGNLGEQVNVYHALQDYAVGKTSPLFVFDKLCDEKPSPTGACADKWDADDLEAHVVPPTGQHWYHVDAISLFYITCVQTTKHDNCPGNAVAVEHGMDKNKNTVEGYFIIGTDPSLGGIGGPGDDAGAWVVFLTK